MVSEPTLVWTSAIIMLDTICIEALNLAIILGDDKLDKHFPLGSEKEPLKLFWVLKLCKSLQMLHSSPASCCRFTGMLGCLLLFKKPYIFMDRCYTSMVEVLESNNDFDQ